MSETRYVRVKFESDGLIKSLRQLQVILDKATGLRWEYTKTLDDFDVIVHREFPNDQEFQAAFAMLGELVGPQYVVEARSPFS